MDDMPLWDGYRGTQHRFGLGRTTLMDLIQQEQIEAKRYGKKKVLIYQPSVARHVESLAPARYKINLTARRRRVLQKKVRDATTRGEPSTSARKAAGRRTQI